MRSENEGRSNFRAILVDEHKGVLHFADAQIRVLLVDQSANGFKVSTEDLRLIPDGIDARLEMDDGVQHHVQIRRVERAGETQGLGLQRLETRMYRGTEVVRREPGTFRRSAIKLLVLLAVVSGVALQAAPVREQLSKLSPFDAATNRKSTKRSGAGGFQAVSVPTLNRDRPFEFRRYLESNVADWLQLESTQRRVMRELLDLCGGARENRLPPAQRALLEFTAQAAMLGQLHPEQRERLEKELDRSLSGSALLRNVLDRYSDSLSREELIQTFGILLVVSPKIAANFGVSTEVAAAVCKRLDETVQPLPDSARALADDRNTGELFREFSRRIRQLETNGGMLPVPTATKPAP